MSTKKVTVQITSPDPEHKVFDGWYSDAGGSSKLSSDKEYQFNINSGETKDLYLKYNWAPVKFILKAQSGNQWKIKINGETVVCRIGADTEHTITMKSQSQSILIDSEKTYEPGSNNLWASSVNIAAVGQSDLPYTFGATAGSTYTITPVTFITENPITTTTTTTSTAPPFLEATINIHNTDTENAVAIIVTPEDGASKSTRIPQSETASVVIN